MSEKNVQIIENVTLDDIEPGDHVIWECAREFYGAIFATRREGIAYDQEDGDWCTETDMRLTDGEGEGITIMIRRPIIKEN